MIICEHEQHSEKWFYDRLGLPTASRFKDIFTSQMKPSSSRSRYMNELLAEFMTEKRASEYTNEHMERGNRLEDDARTLLEFQTDIEFSQVGLVYPDENKRYGCSPDGWNDELQIGCEIKCPTDHQHVKYLLAGKLPAEYVPQVQGSMLVTGADAWYFCSYTELIKPLIIKVERDDEWIDSFRIVLESFCDELAEKKEKLLQYKI